MRRLPGGVIWILGSVVAAYGAALGGWVFLFLASCAVGTLAAGALLISILPLSQKWIRRFRFIAGIVVALLTVAGLVVPPHQPPVLDGGVDAAAFAALPYIDFVPRGADDTAAPGVGEFDTLSVLAGINLYCPTGSPLARLVDLEGRLVRP